MKKSLMFLTGLIIIIDQFVFAQAPGAQYNNTDLQITGAEVYYESKYDMLVFEAKVAGQAGRTVPKPAGSMNGAPVLGYVFLTTLKSEDIGFSKTEGIVAMALTAHPDMDDTPLWDENNDGKYDNDGIIWHAHWVVLVADQRVPGKHSVKEFKAGDKSVYLPKTAPGLPFFFDSPGFNVVKSGNTIRVMIPSFRMNNKSDFKYDALSCYMQMSHNADHHHNDSQPLLGVYNIYGVLSGNVSLPYTVKK